MKSILTLSLILILPTLCLYSQEENAKNVSDVTKLTFFSPGLSYEKAIGKNQTLYGHAFLATSLSLGYSSSMGFLSEIHFDPALGIQYRHYYNARKRSNKGKFIDRNSMNYLALGSETIFSTLPVSDSHLDETSRRAIQVFSALWGFQRNYQKRFSLDLNLGLGYLLTRASIPELNGSISRKNHGQFTTAGQIHLGFWLNRR